MWTRGLLALVALSASSACSSERPPRPGTQWIDVDAPGGRVIRAAVTRPKGKGPFPAVVVLHGADGLRQTHVKFAEKISKAGFITVTGCWFRGSADHLKNKKFPDLVVCPNGPDFKGASSEAIANARALVDAARQVQGVRRDHVGLFGQSRGATMAMLLAASGANVQAVAASAAAYPTRPVAPIDLVQRLRTPLFMLHGTNDEIVNVSEARAFEASLRGQGRDVESHYFEGGSHRLPFAPDTRDELARRVIEYFKRRLETSR